VDSREEIEQAASDWLARRDGDQWTAQNEAELKAWLQSSTAHLVEYLRLEAAWESANRLHAMGAGVKTGSLPTLQDWRASPFFKHALPLPGTRSNTTASQDALPIASTSKRQWPWALAAGLIFAVAISAIFYVNRNTYSTSVGVTTAVPLPDGSKVTLNTASAIRVSVTSAERAVRLEAGEAYFEVAKDEKRPFVVIAGTKRITALGTAFSVRRVADDDVRVVVTEGLVAVGDTASEPVPLAAGSIAYAAKARVTVQKRPVSELQESLSWRVGYIVFHQTPLSEAVAEFNRYNARQIVIQDPSLENIPVSGNFRATNFDAFARLLERGFDIQVEEEGDRLLLGE
jgi:transmembrane sensor